MAMMNPFEQQKKIEGVRHIVAVGSGKGGVGKSTVAANLAVSLSRQGQKVGLLDADIYGPSVPHIMGLTKLRPNVNAQKKIEPLVSHGLKTMSIGYLVDDQSAIIWRGPMLFKAMDQFIRDVEWGELDILLVDLPPGTGDVQLSLVQKVPVSGAIIVSTPQDTALLDVRRCVDMFNKVKTPILGLVENMSTFQCPHCHESTPLFEKGKLHAFCEEKKIAILAEIPFTPAIGVSGEQGEPYAFKKTDEKEFYGAATKLIELLKI